MGTLRVVGFWMPVMCESLLSNTATSVLVKSCRLEGVRNSSVLRLVTKNWAMYAELPGRQRGREGGREGGREEGCVH